MSEDTQKKAKAKAKKKPVKKPVKKADTKKEKRGPKFWDITKEVLQTIEECAAHGLDQSQIYHTLGISHDTWYKYKKAEGSELSEAFKKGKALGIKKVTNKLFERAKGGESDTAIIFFLKNRDPENWARNFDKSLSAPVTFDLNTKLSFSEQCNQVNKAAANGEISMDIANQFITNISNMYNIKAKSEFDDRLKAIEKATTDK